MVVCIKKIIIIPNENIYDIKPNIDTFDDNIDHSDRYKEYAIKNNIKYISGCDVGYNFGVFFAEEYFLNIMIGDDILICFVPQQISENQYNWMKENKEMISKYEISITNIHNYKAENISSSKSSNILNDLYQLIEEKYNGIKENVNESKHL